MRPGQQNRRSRGRNNNRKGPNPLSRNYESNGPDVKIRGSAQHVADKYASLARDAQSSGDRVMAENYLQHAEHYNRIIAAAQAHLAQQAAQENRDDSPSHAGDDNREGGEARVGRNGREARDNRNGAQQASESEATPAADGSGPQPVIEGTPAEVVFGQDGANGTGTRRPRRRGPAAEASGDDAADSPKPARAPRRSSRAPKAAKPDDSQPAAETPEAAGAADAGKDAPAPANQE